MTPSEWLSSAPDIVEVLAPRTVIVRRPVVVARARAASARPSSSSLANGMPSYSRR